jgi:hypothetical protein
VLKLHSEVHLIKPYVIKLVRVLGHLKLLRFRQTDNSDRHDITEVMFTDNKHPNIYGSLEQELPTRPEHLSSPEFLVRFVLLDL